MLLRGLCEVLLLLFDERRGTENLSDLNIVTQLQGTIKN